MTCRVTGTIRIATVPTISHVSSRWYSSIKRLTSLSLYSSPRPLLLNRVDLGEDLVRADLLGVSLDHRIDQLLHLRPVGERHALELAGLLQRVELGGVLARFHLSAVGAGFLARSEHGRLEI